MNEATYWAPGLLFLAVFTLVFSVVLSNPIHPFPVYLLSGLLAWNLFSGSLSLGFHSPSFRTQRATVPYMPSKPRCQ